MPVKILDWIFQRNNVIRITLVDYMKQGCQSRGFTASGRPCNKDKSSLTVRDLYYFFWDTEALRLWNLKRKTSHNGCQCASLPENIDTKTAHPSYGVGKVGLTVML